MDKPDWFLIVFLPASGGNHLANIISSNPKFACRFDESTYNYRQVAHPVHSSLVPELSEQMTAAAGKNSIFCFHFAQIGWYRKFIDEESNNVKTIVIDFPPGARNELFMKRITSTGPFWLPPYKIEEYSWLYSVDSIKKMFDLTDVTSVGVDILFDPDSKKLIDYLNSNFDLRLDYNLVQPIHSRWLAGLSSK